MKRTWSVSTQHFRTSEDCCLKWSLNCFKYLCLDEFEPHLWYKLCCKHLESCKNDAAEYWICRWFAVQKKWCCWFRSVICYCKNQWFFLFRLTCEKRELKCCIDILLQSLCILIEIVLFSVISDWWCKFKCFEWCAVKTEADRKDENLFYELSN